MSLKFTKSQIEAFKSLGINSSEDLLYYFPYRYEVLEYLPYEKWKIDSKVVFQGTITNKPKINYFKGKTCLISFECSTDFEQLKIVTFNRPWLIKQLSIGQNVTIIGKYEGYNKVLAQTINALSLDEVLGIHPVYSLKDKIREKTFLQKVDDCLNEYQDKIQSFVPSEYLKKHDFPNKYEAIHQLHQPTNKQMLVESLNSLKYEEFFKFACLMFERRKHNFKTDENYEKNFDVQKVNTFIQSLPFELTKDQLQACNEILQDLANQSQMIRLLQGDVGCGKTIVSFVAMYAIALAGKQSVLMAPTEILAKQHYLNCKKLFENTPFHVGLLYAGQTTQERNDVLQGITCGNIQLVIGTHSLFQDTVNYNNLGLIITDEQHRFGVKQREKMVNKGQYPDILLMSATPIPRTLASTLYGDMNVSTLTETPNKEKVIHTTLINKNSFIPVIDQITKLLQQGNQMYVICPSIQEDSASRNVNTIYQNLSKYFENKFKVGLIHGQLSNEEKDQVQMKFYNHEIDILVATTVIEVGIDVKSANIMVIYDANRFGLSQLHQLRGRIGRGSQEGYCYLLTDSQEEEALKKLEIITHNSNGFDISTYDLMLRGPGEILGVRQSGLPEFVLGNIINDSKILDCAKQDCMEVMNHLEKYPEIEKYIVDNFDNNIVV